MRRWVASSAVALGVWVAEWWWVSRLRPDFSCQCRMNYDRRNPWT